jgi:hypothetical protein
MTIQTSSNLNQEVPKIKLGLQDKYNEESKQEETKESSKASTKEALNPENIQGVVDQLPEPSGWRILVLPFTPKEKTKGGINYCTRIIRPITNRNQLWLRFKNGSISIQG